jgi:hypothetical protein
MIDMNIAATKTTQTATFWLMRAATASSPRLMKSRKISNQDHLTRNGGGACT